MKVIDLIKKLQSYDKNLEVVIVDDYCFGFPIFNKDIGEFTQISLKPEEGIVENYVKCEPNSKGKYLAISVIDSDYFKPEDFEK